MYKSALQSSPKVTVLLPVFNAEPFLSESVESILGQSFTDFELLAINDGSTDRSREILAAFSDPRLVIVDNDGNRGLIYTLNHGIAVARGEYIARMDADDIAVANRFEKQIAFLDAHPQVALLGSWAELIDCAGKYIQLRQTPVGNKNIQESLLAVNCFIHSSVMFRTAIVREAGGYRQDAIHAEDYEMWLRITENNEADNLPEPLIRYRIHLSQISQRQLRMQRASADAIRAAAWRRRINSGYLSPDTPSPIPGLLARLRGEGNTEGGDYLGWLQLYRAMGSEDMPSQLVYHLLRTAPFNRQAHRELWRKALDCVFTANQLRTLRCYKKRLLDLLDSKS